MKLSELFEKCLNISYVDIGACGNYAVERNENTLYIYFQDSDGVCDWHKNFDFPAKAYKRMGKTSWFAHRGFLAAWKDIEGALTPYIIDSTVKKICIVGYSHGAAIALLCHEYVWYNRPDLRDKIEGYGFGCPRVLWGKQSEEILKRWNNFIVIRNIDDIVTHLPPTFLGYHHVGELLIIGEKGKYSFVEAHYAENIMKELLLYEENKHIGS